MSWRRVLLLLLLLALPVAIVIAIGWEEARRDPIVRRATIDLPDWPEGAPPVTVLLISDIHASRPDMPPERFARIVERLNRLKPDAVMIAGDFVSDKTLSVGVETAQAIAPLKGLKAPLGVYAVFGNHDHWRGVAPMRWALAKAGVRLLENEVARVGPLIVGGVDDSVTEHGDFEKVRDAMVRLHGPKLMLSHGSSHVAFLPRDVTLMLAGHTHCGQIPLLEPGRHCGVERVAGRTLVTSAGLGTSILPLRFGAPPDVWLLRLGPEASSSSPSR